MMNRSAEQVDWLAARYVLGELDADESASFEECLGCDEAAAGAVVAAVRLVEAVAAAKPVLAYDDVLLGSRATVARGRAIWNRPTIALTACLTLVALPFIPLRRPVAVSEPADIVARWQSMPLEHVVGSGLQASLELPATDRLPPWLVAAVAIAAEDAAAP